VPFAFLGFQQVYFLCALYFLLSSTRLFLFFMQQNHIEVFISVSTLSLSSVIKRHNIMNHTSGS